jgi:hypothetical protein
LHTQKSLFPDEDQLKQSQLDETADQIRGRFGPKALHRASGMLYDAEHTPAPRPEKFDDNG